MLNAMTEVSLDDVITLLAFIEADNGDTRVDAIKDGLAMILPEGSTFNIDDLYNQVIERAEVMEA